MSTLETEYRRLESQNSWSVVFSEIKLCTAKNEPESLEAKKEENCERNRYRDVLPYDHSRVKLESGVNDYINASLVCSPIRKDRKYILTQGPLFSTCGHFWQMVWEQGCKAIVMLNKIIEKSTMKCYQYFPGIGDNGTFSNDGLLAGTFVYNDTGYTVVNEGEEKRGFYIVRHLKLTKMASNEPPRIIEQFHYYTWPDFGLPDNPRAFLRFLTDIRLAGCLDSPPVVHCSAGIGRSGMFALIDTCLLEVEKSGGETDTVQLRPWLLDMRKFRMGLIQTPDQLKFTYLAIMEGAKIIREESSLNSILKDVVQNSPVYYEKIKPLLPVQRNNIGPPPLPVTPPPPLPPRDGAAELRRRAKREQRRQATQEKIDQIKTRLSTLHGGGLIKSRTFIVGAGCLVAISVGFVVGRLYLLW